MEVKVFDPAMCCSTGVCGPKVDPALARFASDLDWLAAQGAQVTRYNLSQEPGAFVSSRTISELLQSSGEAALPVVMVEAEVKSSGRYPSRLELARWASVPSELVGAAATSQPPVAGEDPSASACCGGKSAAESSCC